MVLRDHSYNLGFPFLACKAEAYRVLDLAQQNLIIPLHDHDHIPPTFRAEREDLRNVSFRLPAQIEIILVVVVHCATCQRTIALMPSGQAPTSHSADQQHQMLNSRKSAPYF
jgi:hypothetical protein